MSRAEGYAAARRGALARLAERHRLDDLYPAEYVVLLADEMTAAGIVPDGEDSRFVQATRRAQLGLELRALRNAGRRVDRAGRLV